jgi:hypothetical protein
LVRSGRNIKRRRAQKRAQQPAVFVLAAIRPDHPPAKRRHLLLRLVGFYYNFNQSKGISNLCHRLAPRQFIPFSGAVVRPALHQDD